MKPLTESDVAGSLAAIRAGLNADGYDIAITVEDQVVVEVTAGPDACAECLVPHHLMQTIMQEALGSSSPPLIVRYPADH